MAQRPKPDHLPWYNDQLITSSATSAGALIETSFNAGSDGLGNFEVFVLQGQTVYHYWRHGDNRNIGKGWILGGSFSNNATAAPSIIQGSLGGKIGNFEAVVLEGDHLIHYQRDNSASGFHWSSPMRGDVITNKATGSGSIIQSTLGGGQCCQLSTQIQRESRIDS